MGGTNNLRDSLATSLAPSSAGRGMASDLFQAYCTTWDPATWANQIDYASATFTNLPVLNPSIMEIGPVLLGRAGGGSSLVCLGPLYWFGM